MQDVLGLTALTHFESAMISFIEGDLKECQLNLAVVQIGGMGYEVHIPLTTSEKLPALGKEIKLYTHMQPIERTLKLSMASLTGSPVIFFG